MNLKHKSYLASLHTGQWFYWEPGDEHTHKNMKVRGFDKPSMEEIEQGAKDIESKQQDRSEKIKAIREEIRSTKPPQSNPELAVRLEKIEQLLGLREID